MMMNYVNRKVFAFDLDGTLVNDEKEVLKSTKEAINKLISLGGIVVLSSGRMFEAVYPVKEELGLKSGFILSYNGGNLFDIKENKTVFNRQFTFDEAKKLSNFLANENCAFITYNQCGAYTEQTFAPHMKLEEKCINKKIETLVQDYQNRIALGVNKFLGTDEIETLKRVQEKITYSFDYVDVFKSNDYFLEMMPKGINKGASLNILLNYLHLKKEDLFAFGDGENDLPMLDFAGTSIVMLNGSDLVKKHAKYITKSNNEDGISFAIDKIIKGEWKY